MQQNQTCSPLFTDENGLKYRIHPKNNRYCQCKGCEFEEACRQEAVIHDIEEEA